MMNRSRKPALRRRITSSTLALVVAFAAYAIPAAQPAARRVLGVEDYTKWRSISGQEISGDGKWVAYTLQLTNTVAAEAKPVLHLKNLETNDDVKVEHATGGTFSADSKWIAYQVDPGAAQRARAGRGGQGGSGGNPPDTNPAPPAPGNPGSPPPTPPAQPATPPSAPSSGQTPSTGSAQGRVGNAAIPPRRAELRNLTTGTVQSWQDIQTFTFSPTSTHVFLKRRPAEGSGTGTTGRGAGAPGGGAPGGGGGRGGAAETPAGPRGTDVILVDLRTGRHQLLGSVGDIAFNRTGTLLAYTVDATLKDGNGLFVFDTRSGRTATLDNDTKQYARLVWNEEGTAIAIVKGVEVDKMREKDNVLHGTSC
jgi:hypothetical protein